MKRLFSVISVIVLLFGLVIQTSYVKAAAPTTNPVLKVLEIVDVGSSKLTSKILNSGNNNFSVETVTMKKFVASREELDGKYDIIAIPDGGTYSTKTVTQLLNDKNMTAAKAHDTSAILNDITNLKATEIIEDYINKGQPVILGNTSIKNGGNLQQQFYNKFSSNKNVLFYSTDHNSAATKINNFINTNKSGYVARPRFDLTVKPSELSQEYKPGDNLLFTIKMLTDIQSKNLLASLYIDSDFNDRYDPSEVVLEKQITNSTDSISYALPRGYSGIRNWKLEVTDMGTNLKDYQKGTILFTDQKVVVNVLQVQSGSNDGSSLKTPNNMKQEYLSNSKYQIDIDVADMSQFNLSKDPRNPDNTKYSHENINGKYDMLIFGFKDEYNKAAINTNAVGSVRQFIDTKQSILFTHDTIYGNVDPKPANNWVGNFMDDTGQKRPQTNLGLNAPNTSISTIKVNEGLVTKYPYQLGKNIKINNTHNQYYTLDLEDPEVTPWFNIIGSSRDENDSWNHYYTYSKGNITYSGTGHTNSNFPDDEQRLFVNTMYRAFLGSNHAPVITVNTPGNGDKIPAHQKIELSYYIQDFDLKDKFVSTKVFLNEKQVYSQDNVTNGSTIVQSIDHGMPNGGNAVLRIEATDKSGAKSEKLLSLTIVKINANLEVSRTASTNEIVPVNKEIKLNYAINPKEISGVAAQTLGSNAVLSNVTYTETFPPNIELVLPSGFTKTGNLSTGYTVTGNLPSITYNKIGDKYVASPVNFAISVIPITKGQFTLNNAKLSYKDIDTSTQILQFNTVTARSDFEVIGIQLPDNVVLNKGMPKNFALDLKILPENAGIKEIKWSGTNNSIFTINADSGVVTAKDLGAGYVNVRVTDVFGNVKEASTYVTVRIPVENIVVNDITMNVGDTKDLPITITPADAKYGLTIVLDEPSLASIDKDKFKLTALKPGTTNLRVSGINSNGDVISKIARLTVNNILVNKIIVDPSFKKLNKFEEFIFGARIEPENATNKNLIWRSLNPSIVQALENGKVIGKSTGTATIEITAADGGGATTTVKVVVGSPLTGIETSPPEIDITKGDNSKNIKNYLVYHPGDATNVKDGITLDSSDTYILDVDSNGNILAKRIGKASITITVQDEDDKKYSAILKVNVIEPGTGAGDNDKY
ncbi:DUF5057 domain-containing protein [Neobacillus vireti]|uniref:Surface protein containing Ig-like domain n=1 Tax=Neobacillus vireti LMG 21834 TaxID=1131730 RepID=A0AB94ITM0_9BACI|nr:DUF5057 domain-containing protein [Neobacillus vireti]ETI70293.1 surface protein containing Ig-like domain [Neobacillus vireti LMG 21834]KLT16828.1 hypothetical protein AA980_12995 [Neobacillus vireti]